MIHYVTAVTFFIKFLLLVDRNQTFFAHARLGSVHNEQGRFMQTTKNYVSHAAVHIEQALNRMPIPSAKPVVYVRQEIIRDIEALLTREEQQVCDMATD